ncbi:hypothetical protein EW146_g7887 [Bondarzewia mesenterica]|uniref:Uncharacterized protein n=1 Tax=Bondarzewia mesenterica TaxID=1095465 RepID=A0A4S4LIM1_9AGAM|nr:hypothetical protein EW146_g7887 [Bondarzewia mesenterica]
MVVNLSLPPLPTSLSATSLEPRETSRVSDPPKPHSFLFPDPDNVFEMGINVLDDAYFEGLATPSTLSGDGSPTMDDMLKVLTKETVFEDEGAASISIIIIDDLSADSRLEIGPCPSSSGAKELAVTSPFELLRSRVGKWKGKGKARSPPRPKMQEKEINLGDVWNDLDLGIAEVKAMGLSSTGFIKAKKPIPMTKRPIPF